MPTPSQNIVIPRPVGRRSLREPSTANGVGRAIVAMALPIWLAAAPAVPAQEGDVQRPPDGPARADGDYPDIYINDSFEAVEVLESAERLVQRRGWSDAARMLDGAVARYGDKLILQAPGRYRPVAMRAREMIGSWPPAGLAAYRELFEVQARRRFEVAADARDVGLLCDLLERYYCTETGIEIADTLAQVSVEAGAFAQARALYQALLRDHPEVRASPGRIVGRLAVVCALAGDAEAARRWTRQAGETDLDPTLRWMGQVQPLTVVVEGVLADPPAAAPAQRPFEWATFGGGNHRNGAVSFHVDEAASFWRFDGVGLGSPRVFASDARPMGFQRALESGRFLTMNAVIARGMVFVHDAFSAQALRADNGARAWTFSPFDQDTAYYGDTEESTVQWYGATHCDGRLYAVFGREAVSFYNNRAMGRPSTLVCLDADSGREVWRTRNTGFDEAFSRCVFDPALVVSNGKVFAVVRRRRSFGFEDCYLCRFDANTGRVEFQTYLGGASTGGFGFRRATMSVPTLVGGDVIVASNLGTVAAVNAQSGRVCWLTLYRREPGGQWNDSGRGAVAPWHYNPVLADGDLLVCYPLDSDALLLLDVGTGAVRETLPAASLSDAVSILGVREHVLYGLGDTVFAYDLARRQQAWSTPLPPDEQLYGRGLLTVDRLLVPTRARLCNYTLDGELCGTIPWEFSKDAGNVLATPDRLIITGNSRVSAYARRREVWARLRERMAAAPEDPAPALDMAEVALRGNDPEEALASLEEAIGRARGFTAIVEPELKRRFFDDCLALAEKTGAGESPALGTAIRVLGYAAQCAPDFDGEVNYRVRLATLHLRADNPAAAVELYQQMITDRSLRSAATVSASAGRETAGAMSRREIDRLIELHGRKVYARFDALAREWLDAGIRGDDLALLERVVGTYPNAQAAPPALIESVRILRKADRPFEAVRRLSVAYRRYGDAVDAPRVMRLIADCYADAGRPEAAWCWLTKAMRRYPTALVEADGRQVSFVEYRAWLGDVRARVEPSLPVMHLPLEQGFVRTFDSSCYLLDPRFANRPQTAWDAYYVYSDARIHLFDAVDNRARWNEPAACRMKPELLSATDRRAVFTTRHQVFALDPHDGRRVWEYGAYPADLADELTDHEMFASFRVHGVGRNHVVSFQDNGLAACVDLTSGAVVWERSSDLRATGPVALSDLWVAYAALRGGEDVHCILDLDTGEPLNIIGPHDRRRAERMFASIENLLVVTAQSILLVDPFTADLLWELNRDRHILSETVCVDLDGVYFSDDGRHAVKIGVENGKPLWWSDRLPVRVSDGISMAVNGDRLVVSTERSLDAMDAFDGRLLWKGTIPPNTRFGERFLTDSYIVAIDSVVRQAEAPYRAYLFDHRHSEGRIAAECEILELGAFDDVKHITVRDNAILLATDNAIHGWRSR